MPCWSHHGLEPLQDVIPKTSNEELGALKIYFYLIQPQGSIKSNMFLVGLRGLQVTVKRSKFRGSKQHGAWDSAPRWNRGWKVRVGGLRVSCCSSLAALPYRGFRVAYCKLCCPPPLGVQGFVSGAL